MILKAAPCAPLTGVGGWLCGRAGGGLGARGDAGVRRLAGGGGERHASRFTQTPEFEFGLSLRFSASLERYCMFLLILSIRNE